MDKIDLRKYGSGELSMQVFNDQGLYNDRHKSMFLELIDELFLFTSAQLEELQQDLADDLTEN